MYTSCGWFFDELSGIETVQVISYAGRALQLAAELTGNAAIEEEFLERLEKAKGNIAQQPDGRAVYERFVRPASMDLQKAGAHYAVSSLFEDHPEQASIYCFSFRRERQERFGSGLASLVLGRVGVDSTITRESALLSYGALRFGDHSIIAGVRYDVPDEDFEVLLAEARAAFSEANFPEVMRIMDRHFGESAYSLRSLFRDKQREVIDLILTSTLAEAEADYRRLYDRNFNLMRFLTELNIPLPQGFRAAARFVLTSGLRQALRQQDFDAQRVRSLMEEANGINVTPDDSGIGFLFQQALERMMDGLTFNPNNLELLQKLEAAVVVAGSMPFDVNLREAQNGFYQALQVHFPRIQERALRGDDWARQWTSHFTSLGQHLGVRVG
jgi:hypothetical protein